jgi:hypothetical protein
MKLNIKRCGIKLDTRCPVCWRLAEDGGHCFLKCKNVRACWRELQLENVRLQLLEARTAIEFVKMVLNLEMDICLKVVVLLWKIWDARNKTNAGENALTNQEVCGAVLAYQRIYEMKEGGGRSYRPMQLPDTGDGRSQKKIG